MTDEPVLVHCPVCEADVPEGEYCGNCGAHLVTGGTALRSHAYAASPNEHLFHLSPVTTLFPHLAHRSTVPFRLALLLITIGLIVLGYLRLAAPAIALAAMAVPILYLLYLYEVEVYEDEPELVIGLTVLGGVLLGALWGRYTGSYITRTSLLASTGLGVPAGRLIVTAVVIPLAAQLLMLAGALILYFIRQYRAALDGFSFAAAGAMGFVFALTLVELLPELRTGLITVAPALQSALRVLQRGLFLPFIYASTSGIIGASLWLARGRRRPAPAMGWLVHPVSAILLAAVIQVALGFIGVYVNGQARITIIYGVIAALLLIVVRIVIHIALLAEAGEAAIGPTIPCPHCRRMVPQMAFCPHCGIAMGAVPKGHLRRGETAPEGAQG